MCALRMVAWAEVATVAPPAGEAAALSWRKECMFGAVLVNP
jgi:hypothetical protein